MMTTEAQLSLPARMGMMLLGWGTVGVCYTAGRFTPLVAHVIHESALDRLIPFDASAIWLYLSFFLFVPAAYLLALPERVASLTRAMQWSGLLAAIVFVAWPTTLLYPPIPTGSFSGAALQGLVGSDSTQNCLPSLHGAITLLCVFALWKRERPWRSVLFLLWGLAIMWSVVATRRHLLIDLAAGVVLGVFCARLVSFRHSMKQARAVDASGQTSPKPGSESYP